LRPAQHGDVVEIVKRAAQRVGAIVRASVRHDDHGRIADLGRVATGDAANRQHGHDGLYLRVVEIRRDRGERFDVADAGGFEEGVAIDAHGDRRSLLERWLLFRPDDDWLQLLAARIAFIGASAGRKKGT
jgi:hypothetical protein